MRKCIWRAGILLVLLLGGVVRAADKHVVVVVMDGLRPDSITAEDMPTLFALKNSGAFFAHHHPVYLSSTEVNGTAIATGGYPEHSGIVANTEYRPEIELLKPVEVQDLKAVRKGDAVESGRYIAMPTVAEILEERGFRTVVAGTKPVALLLNRLEAGREGTQSVSVFEGQAIPAAATQPFLAAGNFPAKADPKKDPNALQDRWTTRVLVERLWAEDRGGVPAFTTLWLSEPDYAQHGSGPSSPTAKAALRSSDDNLAMVLAALDRAGVRDQTDVIVVSDHGFSTIERNIDLEAELKQAGFAAARKFDKGPAPGSVMVVGNGGEVSLYVIGHDEGVIERLVGFLQRSDFAGVIFTRKAMAGTFDMSQVKIDSETAPDIVVSMRWNDKVSKYGLPGEIVSEGLAKGPGQGNHTSLSKFDMHNTLVASGPDFKKEFVDDLPSGNVDVAPTVLALFGVTGEGMDGRVLREGFAEETSPVGKAEKTRVEAEAPVEGGMWKQYVVISSVEGRVYFDEGNGGVVGK